MGPAGSDGWQAAQNCRRAEERALDQEPHTGTIVSKKLSLQMAVRYHGSKLQRWNASVIRARIVLGYEGRFVPVGGRTVEGQRLLERARHFYPLMLEG